MDNEIAALEKRIRKLENHRASDAKDISWMRENLTLARSQHNWNIATIISILLGLIGLLSGFIRRL